MLAADRPCSSPVNRLPENTDHLDIRLTKGVEEECTGEEGRMGGQEEMPTRDGTTTVFHRLWRSSILCTLVLNSTDCNNREVRAVVSAVCILEALSETRQAHAGVISLRRPECVQRCPKAYRLPVLCRAVNDRPLLQLDVRIPRHILKTGGPHTSIPQAPAKNDGCT